MEFYVRCSQLELQENSISCVKVGDQMMEDGCLSVQGSHTLRFGECSNAHDHTPVFTVAIFVTRTCDLSQWNCLTITQNSLRGLRLM
uniref:Uncharacterized protein n=1 Tax=Rhizophora mucronata TaxID=61149 RepID=A0A2P2IND3_RHIMU